MTVTLEHIEARQSELQTLIETFKKQLSRTELAMRASVISLADGELYAGLVLDENGKPHHHLILLPGEINGKTWQASKEWATSQGGELPTRREQSLLFANLKQHFQKDWYWSSEEYGSDSESAWYQGFYYGGQYGFRKGGRSCRARAVRRLIIDN